MTAETKVPQGTAAWFEMAGSLICEAASRAGLSPELDVSFLERYTDGVELSDDLLQGLRIDIKNGKPSFRVGVQNDEHADIIVEVTAGAARKLNLLHSTDPHYRAERENYQSTGEMRVTGDISPLSSWLDAAHDPIVDRTS